MREGGHCVTASFSRCCCTLEPASRASHEWLCSAGRVPPPQDAVLFTQLAWLEVEASTCPSVASSVGPSCQTADQCSCPRRPPPPTPSPVFPMVGSAHGQMETAHSTLVKDTMGQPTPHPPHPPNAHQLEPGEGGFFSFLWMSPTLSPKPRLISYRSGKGPAHRCMAWNKFPSHSQSLCLHLSRKLPNLHRSSCRLQGCMSFLWCGCSSNFGEANGTPLQYSCLGNPMDGGA